MSGPIDRAFLCIVQVVDDGRDSIAFIVATGLVFHLRF